MQRQTEKMGRLAGIRRKALSSSDSEEFAGMGGPRWPSRRLQSRYRQRKFHKAFERRAWNVVEKPLLGDEGKLKVLSGFYTASPFPLKPGEKMLLYGLIVDTMHSSRMREDLSRYKAVAARIHRELAPEGRTNWFGLGEPGAITHYLNNLAVDSRLTTRIMQNALGWLSSTIPMMSTFSRIKALSAMAALDIRVDAESEAGRVSNRLALALYEDLKPARLDFSGSGLLLRALECLTIVAPPLARSLWARDDIRELLFRPASAGAHLLRLYQLARYADVCLPEDVMQTVQFVVHERRARPISPNDFETDIQESLTQLGFKPESAVLIEGFETDLLICHRKLPVVVECAGDRFHFIDGDPTLGFQGNDRLRNELLCKAGYRVLHIPSSSLRNYPGGRLSQEARIERALERLVRTPAPAAHILGVASLSGFK